LRAIIKIQKVKKISSEALKCQNLRVKKGKEVEPTLFIG
jgi:hypothetical protein